MTTGGDILVTMTVTGHLVMSVDNFQKTKGAFGPLFFMTSFLNSLKIIFQNHDVQEIEFLDRSSTV